MLTIVAIDGMRSVHCTRAVFAALAAVPGIDRAEVAIGQATIEHDGRASPVALRAAIEGVGYTVREFMEDRRRLAVRDVIESAESED